MGEQIEAEKSEKRVTDLTRDRKLKAALYAISILFLGLAACLVAAYFIKDSLGLVVGLYTPFGLGVTGALGILTAGNVKVHQAQSGGQS